MRKASIILTPYFKKLDTAGGAMDLYGHGKDELEIVGKRVGGSVPVEIHLCDDFFNTVRVVIDWNR